ncbi:MAG: helix-turn-helix transcriptional regulator [Candidatus Rokubacteria bacterium]|nr:helix-turn-helix transcriptional regulator [Candidatus Rokubacteria bacterium]
MTPARVEARLASRVRALRQARGLTLEAAARRAGVSKSLLSKIENARVASPLATYARVATAIGATLGDLVGNARPRRRMDPRLVMYPPGMEEAPRHTHAGEEFLFLLKGRIEFVHGDVPFVLGPGDALHLDAGVPHGARALGRAPAVAVVVTA